MIREAWLFQPGDIVYQWGDGWNGYGYVTDITINEAGYPLYEMYTAEWYETLSMWLNVGMQQGLSRDVIEQKCTYVSHYLERPRAPIQPSADPR